MAFPFGGHPTLGRYLAWARDEHGFKSKTGFAADCFGKTHSVTRIFKDGAASVIVSGLSQDEYLTASMVGYLDRRLGLISPWFSVEPDNDLEG